MRMLASISFGMAHRNEVVGMQASKSTVTPLNVTSHLLLSTIGGADAHSKGK